MTRDTWARRAGIPENAVGFCWGRAPAGLTTPPGPLPATRTSSGPAGNPAGAKEMVIVEPPVTCFTAAGLAGFPPCDGGAGRGPAPARLSPRKRLGGQA